VDYNEEAMFRAKILALATQVINFGTVASASFVYIGTDKAITYSLNGGPSLPLAEGGFVLLKGASITSLSITAGILDANVYVLILGD
jgi:hypothetical protein